ncbi:MAG TPA: cytidine deaminase [Chryseolinea sp.]|nr:cytidine deaminase [Chryseolinea sp.]
MQIVENGNSGTVICIVLNRTRVSVYQKIITSAKLLLPSSSKVTDMIKEEIITFNHLEDLDAESKYLVHRAREATEYAYAPYSKFHVGAAIMLDDGTFITASNQENASYPLCMCAERVALYTLSALHNGKKIVNMAIVAHKKNHKELSPATSCGACRQVMLEFELRQGKSYSIVMLNEQHQWIKASSVRTLMPFGFTKSSLET